MSKICGFKWKAEKIFSSTQAGTVLIEQTCILEKDHEGAHRSRTNVICYQTPQEPEQK